MTPKKGLYLSASRTSPFGSRSKSTPNQLYSQSQSNKVIILLLVVHPDSVRLLLAQLRTHSSVLVAIDSTGIVHLSGFRYCPASPRLVMVPYVFHIPPAVLTSVNTNSRVGGMLVPVVSCVERRSVQAHRCPRSAACSRGLDWCLLHNPSYEGHAFLFEAE